MQGSIMTLIVFEKDKVEHLSSIIVGFTSKAVDAIIVRTFISLMEVWLAYAISYLPWLSELTQEAIAMTF